MQQAMYNPNSRPFLLSVFDNNKGKNKHKIFDVSSNELCIFPVDLSDIINPEIIIMKQAKCVFEIVGLSVKISKPSKNKTAETCQLK